MTRETLHDHADQSAVLNCEQPYTPAQVLANLELWAKELHWFPVNLDGGPGYVRLGILDMLSRGIKL